ncbi:MAG TPA: hypothetical protein VGL97_06495 [Bryobacteraceae bacterium]|jgi:hypothetical protein
MPNLHPQTGPVTVAGKEISSRNATTNGGTSEKLIVAGETNPLELRTAHRSKACDLR